MLKYLGSEAADNDDDVHFQVKLAEAQDRITWLEQRVEHLERITQISQDINSTLELNALLQKITRLATELTNTEACSILLYNKGTGQLIFTPATISSSSEKLLSIPVPLENSIAGWVFQKRTPLLIRDVTTDPRWNSAVDENSDFVTRSILGVPLTIKKSVIGVLELLNKKGEAGFGQDDIQVATILAAQIAVAIENAKLWEDIQRAYDNLSELDRLKSEFVAIASHELRTPLAVILGYAGFLKNNVNEAGSEQLSQVMRSAMKLRSLIDDMVNLRHINNDEIELDVEIFSLREMILEVLKEFEHLISAKSLKLKCQFAKPEDDYNIEGDRQKLYLAVANLISNAIKFTPEFGTLLISLDRVGQKLRLRLADSGRGIPQDKLNKIFDSFYQVEPSLTRSYEGLGVGLSIVKGMIDAHHGTIEVDSVVGRGSQFIIMLPISVYIT